ncbi:enzymatic polyprotein [Labeo rohita]|uniref:Enzymatic polyprotein n=1 Tax=Labeo rohita TaxID=84645 RepID=A0ABQ8L0R6_LABRO|nr:enzymatic polyprotein [Labeo rohita]
MKELGLRLKAKKSVLSPLQRTTYLGVVWDSTTMQARLSPTRIKSILTAVTRVKEGRSLTVKQFQRLLGLMAAASNLIPFGLLYMRPLQWWLRTKGFSPRGNPFCMIKVTRLCLRALDMWKKPWFLSQGPVLGAPCRRVTLATDASLTGWGAVMSGHSARGLWSGCHLTWHINCLEMLAVFRALKQFLPDLIGRHVLVRTDNTAVVYYINHQGGKTPLAESSSCSWAYQYGSRHPVEAGAEARGMGSPGTGCHGTDVAEALSVRLSPDRSAPRSSGESAPGRGPSFFSSPVLAGPSIVLGPDFPSRRLSMGDSRQEGSPLSGRRHHPPPSPGAVEVMGVAPDGAHLIASSLSTEVVQTILQSRAPSTRKLYALKWKLFTSWCGHRQQDPVNCPVGTVLEYLQDRFSAGLTHSTLRVYVAAISAYHAPLGGMSVGKDPLVTALLLALTSLKRIGDLQALSVAPSHLEFAPGMARAFLYPSAGYVPKVPSAAPRPVAYEFSDLPSPLGVKAHSTRGISASRAFMSGVPMQDICDAAGWSTPLIFVRFYDLDLRVAPGSSTQLEFLKGNVSGYDCNPGSPKGTRRCVSCHTSCIPASVRFFLKLNAGSGAHALKLPGL